MLQPRHLEHDVIAVEGNGIAVQREIFLPDLESDVACETTARHAVAISHHDVGAASVVELEAGSMRGRCVDEVVHRAEVQQGYKLMCIDLDMKLPRDLHAYASKCGQGDHGRL